MNFAIDQTAIPKSLLKHMFSLNKYLIFITYLFKQVARWDFIIFGFLCSQISTINHLDTHQPVLRVELVLCIVKPPGETPL